VKKISIILGGAAVIILTLIGVFILKSGNNSSKTSDVSVRLKWLDQAQFAGFYTANSKGYYEAKNLKVKLDPGGPDISPTQMVLSGTNDFGVIGADQLVLAREKGAPLVALAVIYQKTPVALASLKESNITSPKDLEGKKTAIVYGKDEEVVYRALLQKENVNRSKIQETPLTFDLGQLTSKKVDAIIVYETNEPTLLAQQGVYVSLIKPRDYGINYYADTLFTTEKMIKEKPEVVKAFVAATMSGWQSAFQDKNSATNDVLAINITLNREHQQQLIELSEALIKRADGRIGYSDYSEWVKLQNILIEQGIQKKRIDIDRLFTNKYLQ